MEVVRWIMENAFEITNEYIDPVMSSFYVVFNEELQIHLEKKNDMCLTAHINEEFISPIIEQEFPNMKRRGGKCSNLLLLLYVVGVPFVFICRV